MTSSHNSKGRSSTVTPKKSNPEDLTTAPKENVVVEGEVPVCGKIDLSDFLGREEDTSYFDDENLEINDTVVATKNVKTTFGRKKLLEGEHSAEAKGVVAGTKKGKESLQSATKGAATKESDCGAAEANETAAESAKESSSSLGSSIIVVQNMSSSQEEKEVSKTDKKESPRKKGEADFRSPSPRKQDGDSPSKNPDFPGKSAGKSPVESPDKSLEGDDSNAVREDDIVKSELMKEAQLWKNEYLRVQRELDFQQQNFAETLLKDQNNIHRVYKDQIEMLKDQVKTFKIEIQKRAAAIDMVEEFKNAVSISGSGENGEVADAKTGQSGGSSGSNVKRYTEEEKNAALTAKLQEKALTLGNREREIEIREAAINDRVRELSALDPEMRDFIKRKLEAEAQRKALDGKTKAEIQSMQFWEVVHERGVAYRAEFLNLESRVTTKVGPQYQQVVACCEYREPGWVRTPDNLWLPVVINGIQVLEPYTDPSQRQKMNEDSVFQSLWGSFKARLHEVDPYPESRDNTARREDHFRDAREEEGSQDSR